MPRTATDPPPLPLPLRPSGDVMRWYGAYAALPEAERPWMGSYAVRAHDPATGTVDVDFFLHGDGNEAAGEGPATRWARSARPGDAVGMFGPSAAFAVQLGRVRAPDVGHRPLPGRQSLPTAGDLTVRPLYGDYPAIATPITSPMADPSALDALRADPLTWSPRVVLVVRRPVAPPGSGRAPRPYGP